MYLFTFIIAILLSISIMRLEFKHRHVAFMLWPLLIIFLYFPLLYFAFINSNSMKNIVSEIFIFICICNLFYLVSFLFLRSFFNDPMSYNKLGQQKHHKYITLVAIAIIISVLIISDFSVSRIASSDLKDKQSLGILYLILIWTLCLMGGQVLVNFENKNYIIFSISVLLCLFLLIYFRSRSIIAVFIFSYIYYSLFFKKVSIFRVGVIGIGAGLLATLLKAIRYQGSLENVTDIASLFDSFKYIGERLVESGDLSIHKYLIYLYENCNALPFCSNYTILQKLASQTGAVNPPDALLEYALYDAYFESGVGGSLHPTLYGIAYGDHGYVLGVLFMFCMGLFNFSISRICNERNFFYLIGFISFFITFASRGSFYNAIVLLFVGVGLTIILRRMDAFFFD